VGQEAKSSERLGRLSSRRFIAWNFNALRAPSEFSIAQHNMELPVLQCKTNGANGSEAALGGMIPLGQDTRERLTVHCDTYCKPPNREVKATCHLASKDAVISSCANCPHDILGALVS
jgi:hypothetical protein